VPGEDVRSDAVRARVRAAIARLPRKQREAVWFRWADGLEYDGVAQKLGCSIESARANVYQGMKRLRRDLSDLLEEIER
jgi:RNA polymerase sigma factor (sigma-70 family)